MGIVAIPHTYIDSIVLTAAQLNGNATTIFNEFNGNIDNENIKAGANIDGAKLAPSTITSGRIANEAITDAAINYASVRLLRAGVPGLKFARGRKAFTLSGGTLLLTITFSSDSDDGNPSFSVAPRLIATVEFSTATDLYSAVITAISTTSCTLRVRNGAGSGSDAGFVHWYAVGA